MLSNLRRTAWEVSPDTMVGILIVSYLVATGSSRFVAWMVEQSKEISR